MNKMLMNRFITSLSLYWDPPIFLSGAFLLDAVYFRRVRLSIRSRSIKRILRRTILKELSMIKKTKSGYEVVSEKSGKKLSKKNLSKKAAKKRLQQIEYFKHKGKK